VVSPNSVCVEKYMLPVTLGQGLGQILNPKLETLSPKIYAASYPSRQRKNLSGGTRRLLLEL